MTPRITAFVLISTALLIGCKGNPRDVAKTTGVVIMDGKPLTGGRIMFQPFAEGEEKRVGKMAVAQIQSDGTFVLTTYEEGDGAVVGKHRPVITGNRKLDPDEAADPNRPNIEGPDIGTYQLDQVCEVIAGQENEFTIEFSSRKNQPVEDDD